MAIKWFFALNSAGDDYANYSLMTQVAVRSARQHTPLEPVFLFDGEPCELTDWMHAQGVQVVHHRTSMYDRLVEHARTSGRKESVSTGAGAYLRLDIPDLCERLGIDDRYVLYTDCDVLFRRDVTEDLQRLTPEFFAAAPQFNRDDDRDMNSGVLWMNVPALREMLPAFREFVRAEMDTLRKTGYDQAALRAFYGKRRNGRPAWERLPLELNWKPHWGRNDRASILHFHGPKPTSRTWLARDMAPPIYVQLAQSEYYRNCREWDTHAHGLPMPPTPQRGGVLDALPGAAPDFDEAAYLHAYPDVARALVLRQFASGDEHYRAAGLWEGRDPLGRTALVPGPEPVPPPPGVRPASRLWSALAARLAPAEEADPAREGELLLIGPPPLAERLEAFSGRPVVCRRLADLRGKAGDTEARRPGIAAVALDVQNLTAEFTLDLLATLRRWIRPGGLVGLWIASVPGPPKGQPGTQELAKREWSREYRVLHVQRRVGGDRHDLAVLRLPAGSPG